MMIRTVLVMLAAVGAVALAGCEGAKEESQGDSKTPASAADASFMLDAEPAGALSIVAAKESSSEGDRVVVRGRIGGRVHPISDDSAMFLIVDASEPSCRDLHGDGCPTPWDYCCATPDHLMKLTATVQLVDDAGAPLALDVREHGFEPLDEVVVVGTVGPRPNENVLVIRATGVHRRGA